jgi:hypothetical protein
LDTTTITSKPSQESFKMEPSTSPVSDPAYPKPAGRKKFPVGLILIIIFVGLGMLGSISSVFQPVAVIGAIILTGAVAYLYNAAMLAIEVFIFVGLIKRREWGRLLGIWYYSYSILVAALMALTFAFNRPAGVRALAALEPDMVTALPERFLAVIIYAGMSIAVILCGIVVAYLAMKKEHFRA